MIEQTLVKQAAEIAAAGHMGWGNTMQDAATVLGSLRTEIERLRDELSRLRELADSEGTRAVECLRRARKAEEERDHYLAQFLASH